MAWNLTQNPDGSAIVKASGPSGLAVASGLKIECQDGTVFTFSELGLQIAFGGGGTTILGREVSGELTFLKVENTAGEDCFITGGADQDAVVVTGTIPT